MRMNTFFALSARRWRSMSHILDVETRLSRVCRQCWLRSEKDLIRSLLYHFHKRDQIHFNTFELPLAVEFALDGPLLDWTRFVTRRPWSCLKNDWNIQKLFCKSFQQVNVHFSSLPFPTIKRLFPDSLLGFFGLVLTDHSQSHHKKG